jgi:hypothetical protein
VTRALVLLVPLLVVGCGESPCQKVCTKLASCSVVTDAKQCQSDCESPPNGGAPCDNEDAIATCMEAATCEQLTDVTSTLTCPTCD